MQALAGWKHEEQKPNFRGFVAFGVGLPRTGTYSLRTALNKLLDGAVYHLFEVKSGINIDVSFWDKATLQKMPKNQWKNFLEGRGFRAGVNFPLTLFYK